MRNNTTYYIEHISDVVRIRWVTALGGGVSPTNRFSIILWII